MAVEWRHGLNWGRLGSIGTMPRLDPQLDPHTAAPPPRPALWRIDLLGGLQARHHGGQLLANFGSRSVAALLARLALYPRRSHAREELIELLWPGVALEIGRNRLRQALFTLRQLLEPPGPVPAPVLVADRLSVRSVPGALDCDVLRFEAAVREGRRAEALALYAGELLPGFYDEWIEQERRRCAVLFERVDASGVNPGTGTANNTMDASTGASNNASNSASRGPAATASSAASLPATSHAAETPRASHEAPDPARSMLPVYLTRFFGREAQGARLRAEVLGHRLVTLLGPGGSGKTRLAVELAESLRDSRDAPFDFVAFVSLVNCATRAQMLDALLAGLHLRQTGRDEVEPLVAALTGRHALLVLDNFEQLAGHAEALVAQVTTLIPGLHLLVTSRRVLGLDGEREFAVQPLELPRAGLALAEVAIVASVALFVDRARAARADFHIGPRNVEAVVEIVHRLEGMPLAIELAAARVRSIAPVAMAALLRDASLAPQGHVLELLHRSGPRHGLDSRHASMLGVIEWSWRLLAPAQAQLLAALTVFHGGFTAPAAEAVCGALARPAGVRLDELVSQSLLRAQASDEAGDDGLDAPARYQSLEPVREYAAMQLDEATARSLRSAHRRWLSDWARTLPATPALAELRAELPNLLAALASAVADDAPDEGVRLALPLHRLLEDVELPAEGLASLASAVDRCADADLATRGRTMLGPRFDNAGRPDPSLAAIDRALAGAPPGSPWRAGALYAAARVRYRQSRDALQALPLLDEAEPLAQAAKSVELQAGIHALRAFVTDRLGDHAAGEALHAQALALWERLGNQHAINNGRYNLAACAQNAGRHEEALQRLAVIEASARRLHDLRRLGQTLNVRGNAYSELGLWTEAAACFRESLRLTWSHLVLYELAFCLWNLPRALAHLRQPEAALQLAAFAAEFWQRRFGRLDRQDEHDLRRVRRLAAVQGIAAARREALWQQGAQMPLADAVALALRA
ncbi:hypothetical protein BH11PSE9_BH11PSE9_09970 [soil metagenome]